MLRDEVLTRASSIETDAMAGISSSLMTWSVQVSLPLEGEESLVAHRQCHGCIAVNTACRITAERKELVIFEICEAVTVMDSHRHDFAREGFLEIVET